jgi:hypothetical protein
VAIANSSEIDVKRLLFEVDAEMTSSGSRYLPVPAASENSLETR